MAVRGLKVVNSVSFSTTAKSRGCWEQTIENGVKVLSICYWKENQRKRLVHNTDSKMICCQAYSSMLESVCLEKAIVEWANTLLIDQTI